MWHDECLKSMLYTFKVNTYNYQLPFILVICDFSVEGHIFWEYNFSMFIVYRVEGIVKLSPVIYTLLRLFIICINEDEKPLFD